MHKRNIKILLVDDDVYFRLAVKEVISDFCLIHEATSADEAIELINQEHFDIALIDMQMQTDECGLRVLESSTKSNIHSIILSSYDNDIVTQKCYEKGCEHFLAKIHYLKSLPSYLTNYLKAIRS